MRAVGPLRVCHRWLGLGVLAVLFVASATGSVLAYKKELIRVLVTPHAILPAALEPADLALQLDRIAQRFPPPERELIKAPNAEEPYWTLTGTDGRIRLLAMDSLAPYTSNTWVLETLAVVRHIHTELLAASTGEIALLAIGLMTIVLAVVGLILWWPGRARCRWSWVRPRSLASPQVLQHHRHFGAIAALPLLLSVLTGSVMLWQKSVGPLAPITQDQVRGHGLEASAPPSRFLLEAMKQVPDAWPTYIRLGVGGSPEISFRLRVAGEWHPNGRSSVEFDPEASRARVNSIDQAPAARKLLNQAYPLHAGYGLPALYSLFVAVTGICTCWLCLSGVSSWLRQRRQPKTVRRNEAGLVEGPAR